MIYSCIARYWKLISAASASPGNQAPVLRCRPHKMPRPDGKDRAHSFGRPGLGSPRPPGSSARLHREQARFPTSTQAGGALKPGGRPSAASQKGRATATPPSEKIKGGGGRSRDSEASDRQGPFPLADSVPSAQRGQKSPEAWRARLRPRSAAPPRKEAREAAAPLRRFY